LNAHYLNMRLIITLSLLSAVVVFAGSCNKGPTAGIPFYMKMDTAVVINPHSNFSASSNTQGIQDVWVQEGANNIGAYELPCNFPVLDDDSVHFVVQAGIWESAQSTNPIIYPFMNPDIFTMYATPGKQYSHVPTFSYKSVTVFQFNEDFETGGGDYGSNMPRSRDSVKYGLYCGKMTVGPNDSSVTACQATASGGTTGSTIAPYTLTSGQEIWIELDYKSDVPFWSGIIAHFTASGATDTIQVLFLLPTTTWTKEYINISSTVGNEGANTYNLYFQALNPSGFAGGSVYLDNIRLLHASI
jgi:hypothetical protein